MLISTRTKAYIEFQPNTIFLLPPNYHLVKIIYVEIAMKSFHQTYGRGKHLFDIFSLHQIALQLYNRALQKTVVQGQYMIWNIY